MKKAILWNLQAEKTWIRKMTIKRLTLKRVMKRKMMSRRMIEVIIEAAM